MIHDYRDTPVFFDFETQSPVDLKKVGGRLYAESPDTRVLSLSVLADRMLYVWIPEDVYRFDMIKQATTLQMPEEYKQLYDILLINNSTTLPAEVVRLVEAGQTFAAHNLSHFDYHIWNECVYKRGLGPLPEKWADTLYLARIAGLPVGGLDQVAEKMLGASKDAAKRLVMPLTQAWYEDGECQYPKLTPGLVEPLIRYCSVDTLLLAELWKQFDDLRVEQDVIQTHQNINDRGILADLTLAAKISEVSVYAAQKAAEEIEKLTAGELYGDYLDERGIKQKGNLRSLPSVHAWLEQHGVRITDHTGTKKTLRKEQVEKALANPLLMLDHESPITMEVLKTLNETTLPLVSRVLRLRASAVRITASKVDGMRSRRSKDGRLRDLLTYHKAHTGRWSSQGIQVHNLPRGKRGVDVRKLLALHESGEWSNDVAQAYHLIAAMLPDTCTVDDALSALIRPCLVAPEGRKLVIADYMAIEARGIAWLAGEEKLLDIFRSGRDPYCEFASILYNRTITKSDNDERQLGKICILALGYGMGVEKFALSCSLQGVDLRAIGISPERCVETYRANFPKIAGAYSGEVGGRAYRRGGIWTKLEQAAFAAVAEGGLHRAEKIAYYYKDGSLRCVLPSGRELRYFNCRIEERVPGYVVTLGLPHKTKPTLVYDSQYGSESVLYGGKHAENVVQALCRDIMASAMVKMDAMEFEIVCDVHDEIVTESTADPEYDLKLQCEVMSTPPAWALDFPIGVEGYIESRYLKSKPTSETLCGTVIVK